MDDSGTAESGERADARNKNDFHGSWSVVNHAVEEILRKNCSCLSFKEIYCSAYRMILSKHGERLYDGVRNIVTEHLTSRVRENVLGASDDADFLRTLDDRWLDHRAAMATIRNMFAYMDKAYVRKHDDEVDSVYDLGLVLFRDIVVRHDRVRDRLRESLLSMVMKERDGEQIDRVALRNACKMLVTLGIRNPIVYRTDFEIPFLEQSSQFYSAESRTLLAENDASVYIRKAKSRIDEESERARSCFDVSTENRIIQVVKEQLIENQIKTIVEMKNSGFVFMIKNQRTSDLCTMHELFSKYPDGVKIMAECLNKYVQEECHLFLNADDTDLNPVAYVQSILNFKDKLEYFLGNLISSENTFNEAISEFDSFLTFNPKLPPYIALFINKKLKKGNRVMDEDSLDVTLDKALVLFRHLQDKDVFETCYRQYLAKRILLNPYESEDNEKNFISKLKTVCGHRFTYKLEGMLKDISFSKSEMDSFIHSHNVPSSNIAVHVLTKRFWPLSTVSPKCILPIKPLKAYEEFRLFYLTRQSRRQLNLQPQLGWAHISAEFYDNPHSDNNAMSEMSLNKNTVGWTFDSSVVANGNSSPVRKYLFQVSTYQMAILMLFNSYEKMTMKMIMDKTNINEKDLIMALQSLSMEKHSQRILLKNPKTKEIELQHEFSVNESYDSKSYRVRIKSINSLERENESNSHKTMCLVNEDRKNETEAVILRIMKIRRKMTHSALIMEVTNQLKSRYLPSPALIKNRIESLIERKCLIRSPKDRFTYIHADAEKEFTTSKILTLSRHSELWDSKQINDFLSRLHYPPRPLPSLPLPSTPLPP